MRRINELIAERDELFRRSANGALPAEERARIKDIAREIAQLWDAHRRAGHPPAIAPFDYDWERPRRGRKPRNNGWREDNAA